MPTTAQLLTRALEIKRASAWCRTLNITESTISHAKKKGHLSPALAASLAIEIGADPIYWGAVAAAEVEPESPLKERMLKSLERHKSALY